MVSDIERGLREKLGKDFEMLSVMKRTSETFLKKFQNLCAEDMDGDTAMDIVQRFHDILLECDDTSLDSKLEGLKSESLCLLSSETWAMLKKPSKYTGLGLHILCHRESRGNQKGFYSVFSKARFRAISTLPPIIDCYNLIRYVHSSSFQISPSAFATQIIQSTQKHYNNTTKTWSTVFKFLLKKKQNPKQPKNIWQKVFYYYYYFFFLKKKKRSKTLGF